MTFPTQFSLRRCSFSFFRVNALSTRVLVLCFSCALLTYTLSFNFRPFVVSVFARVLTCVQAALRAFWARSGLPDSRGAETKKCPTLQCNKAEVFRCGFGSVCVRFRAAAVLPSVGRELKFVRTNIFPSR